MANIELGVPNTPQTVFRLGSVTKQFTAMAIMMLQERGKLRVSDPALPVSDRLPGGVAAAHHQAPADAHGWHSELHELSRFRENRRPADIIRRHGRDVQGQAAGIRARRKVRLQQLGLLPARADHRARVRQALRRLPSGEHLRAARDEAVRVTTIPPASSRTARPATRGKRAKRSMPRTWT